jgi:hypothetical protein
MEYVKYVHWIHKKSFDITWHVALALPKPTFNILILCLQTYLW